MPLCGSSFCGCALVSVPAAAGEIDGHLPTIDVTGNGTSASPFNLTLNDEWASAVAARVSGIQSGFVGPITTDANGDYTLTFPLPYAATPIVVATRTGTDNDQLGIHIVSRSVNEAQFTLTKNDLVQANTSTLFFTWVAIGTLA